MGVWGKGQLEHVSDGELLNSTLWITFWRDYKMIFSIGSLAHARAPFLVSKNSNLVSKLPTNSTGSPAHEEIDLGYASRLWTLA